MNILQFGLPFAFGHLPLHQQIPTFSNFEVTIVIPVNHKNKSIARLTEIAARDVMMHGDPGRASAPEPHPMDETFTTTRRNVDACKVKAAQQEPAWLRSIYFYTAVIDWLGLLHR